MQLSGGELNANAPEYCPPSFSPQVPKQKLALPYGFTSEDAEMIIKSLIYYGEVNKKKRTKTKPSFKELKQCGLIKIQAVVRGWLTRKNKQVLQPVDSYSFSLVPECFHAVQPAKMDLSKSILLNAFLCSFGQSTRVNPWRYLHENEEMLWGMLKLKGDAIVSSMFFETIQHLAKWHATLQLLIEKVCVLLSKLKQEEGDEILLAKRTVTEMVDVVSSKILKVGFIPAMQKLSTLQILSSVSWMRQFYRYISILERRVVVMDLQADKSYRYSLRMVNSQKYGRVLEIQDHPDVQLFSEYGKKKLTTWIREECRKRGIHGKTHYCMQYYLRYGLFNQ